MLALSYTAFLGKSVDNQLVKILLVIVEPHGLFMCFREQGVWSCSEPFKFNHLTFYFYKIHFNVIFPLCIGFPVGSIFVRSYDWNFLLSAFVRQSVSPSMTKLPFFF